MLPDEFAALTRAKEQIQLLKNGKLKKKDIHHGNGSDAAHSLDKQNDSNATFDMKGKTEEYAYDDCFLDSNITPTSTIKMIQDNKFDL